MFYRHACMCTACLPIESLGLQCWKVVSHHPMDAGHRTRSSARAQALLTTEPFLQSHGRIFWCVCIHWHTFFLVTSPSMWHGMINILILPVVLESGSVEGLKLTFFPWASLWCGLQRLPLGTFVCFLCCGRSVSYRPSSYSHCSEVCFTWSLPSDVASFFHGVLWEILHATPGRTHVTPAVSSIQGKPWLHIEFKARLCYKRLCIFGQGLGNLELLTPSSPRCGAYHDLHWLCCFDPMARQCIKMGPCGQLDHLPSVQRVKEKGGKWGLQFLLRFWLQGLVVLPVSLPLQSSATPGTEPIACGLLITIPIQTLRRMCLIILHFLQNILLSLTKTLGVPKLTLVPCLSNATACLKGWVGVECVLSVWKALGLTLKNLHIYMVHTHMKDLNFEELFKGSLLLICSGNKFFICSVKLQSSHFQVSKFTD